MPIVLRRGTLPRMAQQDGSRRGLDNIGIRVVLAIVIGWVVGLYATKGGPDSVVTWGVFVVLAAVAYGTLTMARR